MNATTVRMSTWRSSTSSGRQSWCDDAVVLDVDTSTYANPDKVRRIDHRGRYYSVQGPHHSRAIATAHAVAGPRPAARPAGWRLPANMPSSSSGSPPASRTRRARRRRCARHRGSPVAMAATSRPCPRSPGWWRKPSRRRRPSTSTISRPADVDGVLALLGGHTDKDFTGFDPRAQLKGQTSKGITTVAKVFEGIEGSDEWTFADLCDYLKLGYTSPTFVGTPEQIADTMEAWMDGADIDGFILAPVQAPGDLGRFRRHGGAGAAEAGSHAHRLRG